MKGDKDDGQSAESWTVRDGRDAPTSRASAPQFSPGDVVLERYELREVLGRGGMGVVFRTYDRVLDQEIAIKIVRAEYAGDPGWAQRLAREVKLARQINHPNVCRVFDVGQADWHPFLTMELARRGTLRDELARGRPRALEERVADARMIASGLAAIHAAGIVHRDLALQNLLRLDDGSVVVSDFGLATDRLDGNSSVQGGTPAYMAPEVLRGARSSTASDMWSLGVVIHESVFGVRPQWSPTNRVIRPPSLGRQFVAAEFVAFQVCRACLSVDPARRPERATDVERWLTRGRPAWRVRRTVPAMAVAAGFVLVGAALVSLATFRGTSHSAPTPKTGPALVVPTGEPEDWTEQSRVLAEVPGHMDCMVALPDGESLRFVWGRPRRAEDVNIRTGRRIRSALIPEAFAEGCPDTAGNGRVVFSGYTAEGYPFAFVSEHPDGSAATPVVATDPPSVLSDPVWFPDGDRFEYEIDGAHTGIYSVSKKQTIVLPGGVDGSFTTFAGVTAGRTVLLPTAYDLSTAVQIFSSPFVGPAATFRVPFFVTHVESADGRLFFMAISTRASDSPLVAVDAAAKQGRYVASIRGQGVRKAVFVRDALAFTSLKVTAALVVAGRPDVPIAPDLVFATRCGAEMVAQRFGTKGRSLVRLDEHGNQLGVLKTDDDPSVPQCAPDGRTMYYIANQSELRRCENGACSTVMRDVFTYSLSPDGKRVAVLTTNDPPVGLFVRDSGGAGPIQALAGSENPCVPTWETNDLLWVSVRRGRSFVWEQFAVDSGKRTGRTAPGQADCTDGEDDPASPFKPDVRIIPRVHNQVRLAPRIPAIALPAAAQAQPEPERR